MKNSVHLTSNAILMVENRSVNTLEVSLDVLKNQTAARISRPNVKLVDLECQRKTSAFSTVIAQLVAATSTADTGLMLEAATKKLNWIILGRILANFF